MQAEVYTGRNRAATLRAALAYAQRGVPVFPCRPGGKEPLTPRGHLDATTDRSRITAWWNRWPGANIGVPTGERTGLLVLDVDHPAGLDALEAEHGELPTTRTHGTGSGGMHHLYRYPAGAGVRNSAGKLAPGLDIRGEGGYVIVPPSATTRPYEVLDRLPLAEPPAWLLEALSEPERPQGDATGGRPAAVPADQLHHGPIPQGQRNWRLYLVACSLRGRGHDEPAILEALERQNLERCAPVLEHGELRKIAASACRHEPGNAAGGAGQEVLEVLEGLAAAVEVHGWRSMGGHTERDVYVALLRFAARHGAEIPAGVRVSVSMRDLAEEAAVGSTATVWKATNRLRQRGLVRRDGTGGGPKAGAFVLVAGAARATANTPPPGERLTTGDSSSVRPCAPPLSAPRLRWSAPGRRRLGKIRGRVVDVLEARGPMRLEQLAAVLGHKRPRDLRRRHLDDPDAGLVGAGVVECFAGEYRLTAGWRDALELRREQDGELEAARMQRERHDRAQQAFRDAWQQGAVVSHEEVERRRGVIAQERRGAVAARRRGRQERERLGDAAGTISELERVDPVPQQPVASVELPALAVVVREYLRRNPHRRKESASWLAVALWADELVEVKPAAPEIRGALEQLEKQEVAA